jgi:hypothetical protein
LREERESLDSCGRKRKYFKKNHQFDVFLKSNTLLNGFSMHKVGHATKQTLGPICFMKNSFLEITFQIFPYLFIIKKVDQ